MRRQIPAKSLKSRGTCLALSYRRVHGKLLTSNALMSSNLLRITIAAAAVWIAAPAAARAQIYSWHDANGNLVLSDRPKDPSARTFAVGHTGGFRTTMRGASRRSAPYDALIDEHSAVQDVDAGLVRAVIQAESAFNPHARSHKGAMGLMQLMPVTAAVYGVIDPYDPAENIRAGVAYLKSLLMRYSHNAELALAAYNAGPAAVERYGTVPPYRETRAYVARVRTASGNASGAPRTRLYRSTEVVNGHEITKYSNLPSAGAEIVKSASLR
jgi:soluble lytic murein transglycosylase-like protein